MKTVCSKQIALRAGWLSFLEPIVGSNRAMPGRARWLIFSVWLATIFFARATEGVFLGMGNTVYNHGIYSRATKLTDGRVLITGGRIYGPNNILTEAEIFDPTTRTFHAVGGMSVARNGHTATLLQDGRVLVTGGQYAPSSAAFLASAEVFDPVTETFSAAGNMNAARYDHTATLLDNGKVLLTGGWTGATTASAEVFDPEAGNFTLVGNMTMPRNQHRAVLLPSSSVLVMGGNNEVSGNMATAELFDPGSGTFESVNSMNAVHTWFTATALSDGKVLVVGGYDAVGQVHNTVEIYDPASGTFSLTGSLNYPRAIHAAAVLPGNRVLVVGGYHHVTGAEATAEIFDVATGTFQIACRMAHERYSPNLTSLDNGSVLVTGGFDDCLGNLASAELFEPAMSPAGMFSELGSTPNQHGIYSRGVLLENGQALIVGGRIFGPNNMVSGATLFDPTTRSFTAVGPMAYARSAPSATTLSDGRVLVAGGQSAPAAGADRIETEFFSPITGVFTPGPNMSNARSYHTATRLNDGRVLIVGGYTGFGIASADLFDPTSGTIVGAGSMSISRSSHAAVLLPDGKVLVVGGTASHGHDSNQSSAELFDPISNTFRLLATTMSTPRGNPTAVSLANGKVLITGGVDALGQYLNSAEVYDPSTQTFHTVGSMAIRRANHLPAMLPEGKVMFVGGNADAGSAGLASTEIYDPLTETFSPGCSLATGRTGAAGVQMAEGKYLVVGGYDNCIGNLASAELFEPMTATTIDPVVQWPTPAPISFGIALSDAQLNAVATASGTNVNGTFTYTPSDGTVLNVGPSQTLSVTFTPVDTAHFSTVSRSVLIDVIDITAECAPDSRFSAVGSTPYNHGAVPAAARLPDDHVIVLGGVLADHSVSPGASLYDPITRLFSDAGPMNHARNAHTATELAEGQVLITGGQEASGAGHVIAAAEVYDPVLGSFRSNAGMHAARFWHSAVRLSDGRVWVGGGYNNGFNQASAEIYDPATDAFSLLPAGMNSARAEFTATLLTDGRVLIVGGFNDYSVTVTATAELFDPFTGTFEATESLHGPRASHAAALLPDGKVLIVGGRNASYTPLATAEVYDPATGTFTIVGEMNKSRAFFTATVLPGGCVLVVGGGDAAESGLASAEIYEPATRCFGPLISMAQGRYGHTATALQNGTVLVVAGRSASAGDLTSAELFGPLAEIVVDPTIQWATPASIPYGVALSGLQLNATATDYGTNLNGAYTYTPPAGTVLNVGANQTLSVTFTPADAVHFNTASYSVSIDVTQPPPVITAQPSPQSVCSGETANFTVSISGTVSGYQWRKDGVHLTDGGRVTGANAAILTLSAVDSANAGQYDVILSYSSGSATSVAAALVVRQPPQIVTGPADAAPVEGEFVVFMAVANGTAPLAYQWRKDGLAIPGAALASVTLGPLVASDSGVYDVVVSGVCSPAAISAPALLTVVATGNTPAGENVTVDPVDPATGTSPVSVTFSETSQPGETTVTSSQTGPPPPDGFKVGKVYYDVSTTASFSGLIQLCFSYAGLNVGNESKLKLFHFQNGGWVDVTTSLDTVNDIICGTTISLSPFAVFEEDNQAPVITAITGPNEPMALGAFATVMVSFTDANPGDTHTVTFAWDDGGAGTTVAAAGGSASAAHTFAAAGVYTVAVTVTDGKGGTASGAFEYVVIYDPSGGFVTGGGWIQSPAGAYVAESTLSGKATFGFNSKYQRGVDVPTGDTEFKLHFANFTFRSAVYQWLVVAGAKAQYKGTGTINGSGNFGFLLTARDGHQSGGGGTDRFRLKIWDNNLPSAPVIYDNAMGASDDIDQANPQALGGGSIVIHH